LFFNCTVAFGTGVPSGKVTLIFRATIVGASGTVMVIDPDSPTITVIDAACNVAPEASTPAVDGVVGAVSLDGCCPGIQTGGHTVTVGTDNVNVTGPDDTVVRAAPLASVAKVLVALLLKRPGASGAVQRTETPVRFSPDAVFTEIATDDRIFRSPDMTVIGM
jgi:hypothetical protein